MKETLPEKMYQIGIDDGDITIKQREYKGDRYYKMLPFVFIDKEQAIKAKDEIFKVVSFLRHS